MSGVSSYSYGAFYNCTGLTKIPDSVKVIGFYAFSGCVGLENVELNAAVRLQPDSFQGCTNLKHLFIADE